MLDDTLTSWQGDKAPAKDNHAGMSSVQREVYVFAGAAKDSATTAVESPGSIKELAIGAATSVAVALLEPRARPLTLSLQLQPILSFLAGKSVMERPFWAPATSKIWPLFD